jgi:hypothetical protein
VDGTSGCVTIIGRNDNFLPQNQKKKALINNIKAETGG